MWKATGGSATTVLTESQITVRLHPCTALRHIAVGGRAVGVGTQIAEGMFGPPTLSFSFCRVSRTLWEIRGNLFQAAQSLSVYSRPCRGER
jgi:hypothetical protein